MQFRIVGPHIHQAVAGGSTFSCWREAVATEAGLAVSWWVSKDKEVLRKDCRTLNEAKNFCRSAVAGSTAVG